MKKYHVVIVGFAHMHINDVARCFSASPRMEIVACADTPRAPGEPTGSPYMRGWNQDFCVRSFQIPRVYDDWRRMLRDEKPDIAVVTSENDMHLPIVVACAGQGIAVCLEKPMATDLSAALQIERLAAQRSVPVATDWPFTWNSAYHALKRAVDQGAIGRILQFKIRTSHTGPLGAGAQHKGVDARSGAVSGADKARTWWHQAARGGGAMLDFCCYGSILSRWLIDEEATAAFGMRANLNSGYGDADDNAVLVVRYPSSLATIETSWTTPCELMPNDFPMLYGTDGAATIERAEQGLRVKILRPGEEPIYLEPEPLPEDLTDIASAISSYLDSGAPPHETMGLPLNVSATRILDAGMRSSASGSLEIVRGNPWQIG